MEDCLHTGTIFLVRFFFKIAFHFHFMKKSLVIVLLIKIKTKSDYSNHLEWFPPSESSHAR